MIELLRAQLLALRAQIDAMLAVLDTVDGPTPSPDLSNGSQCQHLETENVGTFGAPEFRCTMCKATVPRPS